MRRGPRLPLETLQPYLLTVPDPAAPLDWAAVFGNAHPVELEVGFGKGLFLLASTSEQHPSINFVSVEIIRRSHQCCIRRRVWQSVWRKPNVRVACTDAAVSA